MRVWLVRLLILLRRPSWLCIWTRLRHFLWVITSLQPLRAHISCVALSCFLCVWFHPTSQSCNCHLSDTLTLNLQCGQMWLKLIHIHTHTYSHFLLYCDFRCHTKHTKNNNNDKIFIMKPSFCGFPGADLHFLIQPSSMMPPFVYLCRCYGSRTHTCTHYSSQEPRVVSMADKAVVAHRLSLFTCLTVCFY